MLTYRGTVYPWHCDHMGHMNVMWYVGKFDEGTWNFLSAVGLTTQFMREHGSSTAGVEQNITYKKELFAGDVISVFTTLLEARDRVIRIRHEMKTSDTDKVAAIMVLTIVHLDGKSRRATPFPMPVKARLESLPIGEAIDVVPGQAPR